MSVSSKRWVFTLNNPEDKDEPSKWANVEYALWQLERGASDTPHLQGLVVLKTKQRLSAVKSLNGRAHWEMMRGSLDQSKAYCSKEETRVDGPWTVGTSPAGKPGGRSDLLVLQAKLDEGASEREIAEEMFGTWTRNYRAIERYKRLRTETNRNWATVTSVFWGPPGTGKTYKVNQLAGPEAFWLTKPGMGQTPFFDGYDGQEDVVIDEFFGWLSRDLLCRMCDRYPLRVNTKGGTTNFYPRRIWITSNQDPRDWWRIGLGPMERRLQGELGSVTYMGVPWTPPVQPVGVAVAGSQPEAVRVYDSDEESDSD